MYFSTKITNNNNIKNIYKVINEATNKNTKSTSYIKIFDDCGKPLSSAKDMANFCNKYYVYVRPKRASKIKESSNLSNKYPNFINSMFLKPIDRT